MRRLINRIISGNSITDFVDKDIQRFIIIKLHIFIKVDKRLTILIILKYTRSGKLNFYRCKVQDVRNRVYKTAD